MPLSKDESEFICGESALDCSTNFLYTTLYPLDAQAYIPSCGIFLWAHLDG